MTTPLTNIAANTPEFETIALIKPAGFREYDARWWFGMPGSKIASEINLPGMQALGLGLGELIHASGIAPHIVVGQDYRAYSLAVKQALMLGLIEAGIEIHDIGLCLSPTAYFAQEELNIAGVAMVTASHNDNGWTGVKMGIRPPLTFGPEEMAQLKQIVLGDHAKSRSAKSRSGGRIWRVGNMRERHIADIVGTTTLARRLKIVVACGNGVAGLFAPKALRLLGAEVIELDCLPDHSFPRYNPNPEDAKMLEAMAIAVTANNADLALGFDGDGDRCGVVDETGTPIFADKIGLLLARDLSGRHANAHFVVDVKSTGLYATDPVLVSNGASSEYYKTGHSYIKRRVLETGALAGFEKSGHFFFAPPLGRGYDDALVAAREILIMLANNPEHSLSGLVASLPPSFSSLTMSAHCPDEEKYSVAEAIAKDYAQMAEQQKKILERDIMTVNRLNGVRVTLEDGSWLLVRASSNKPELVVVVESMVSEQDMRDLFRREVKPRLQVFAQIGSYNQEI